MATLEVEDEPVIVLWICYFITGHETEIIHPWFQVVESVMVSGGEGLYLQKIGSPLPLMGRRSLNLTEVVFRVIDELHKRRLSLTTAAE